MVRGAWWAAVHRVAQSRTRLKRLRMHACIGEGNGNPLQCSCLENPRDGGAWGAAVYGVAQSRTRLKRLSGSSSIEVVTVLNRKCGGDLSGRKERSPVEQNGVLQGPEAGVLPGAVGQPI